MPNQRELDRFVIAFPSALKAFNAPPEILEIIERTVSLDPAERQPNAEVLLAEINFIQGKHHKNTTIKKPIAS